MTKRRSVLAAAGGVLGGTALGSGAGSDGALVTGGDMALSEPHNVSGDLWIGPAAGLSEVSPEVGRVYMAVDDQVEYYGDGSSWVGQGVGTESKPAPPSHFEKVTTERLSGVYDHIAQPGELENVVANDVVTGDTVWVAKGTHSLGASGLAKMPSDTTVVVPSGTTIKWADGVQPTDNIFDFQNEENATIRIDGTIDLNRGNTTEPSTHTNGAAATLTDATNVILTGSGTIKSPHFRHFHGYTADSCVIEGFRLTDPGTVAIEIDHGCTDCVVRDVTAVGPNSNPAFKIDQSADFAENNRFVECVSVGFSPGFTSNGVAGQNNKFVRCRALNCDTGINTPAYGSCIDCYVRPTSGGPSAITDNRGARIVNPTIVGLGQTEIQLDYDGTVDGATILGGGGDAVNVTGNGATVSGVTSHSSWSTLVKVESAASDVTIRDCEERLNDASTTVASAGSSGDSLVEISANSFDPGQWIDITLDDASTQSTRIKRIAEDATYGDGDIIEITGTLNGSVSSGNSVANAASPKGLDIDGTDCLIDGNHTIGGVDTADATTPTTGANI